ncbi:hypothetical protein Pelo_5586 [Pelomyxa schiedti]|nr:hypothetical protein Pelo_5586 [Pelomyxa schiedti]
MYYVNPNDRTPLVGVQPQQQPQAVYYPPPPIIQPQLSQQTCIAYPASTPTACFAPPAPFPMSTGCCDPSAAACCAPPSSSPAVAAVSIVPREFSAACDSIYDTLPKMSDGSVSRGIVCGEWVRYEEPQRVIEGVYEVVEHGGFDGRGGGASKKGFSLGCYLLASRKPGVAFSAPQMCSAEQFIASGFRSSKRLEGLFTDDRRFYYNVLSILLACSLLFGIVSLIYWILAPAATVTLGISIYFFWFYTHYPFLLRNKVHLARSVLAFGILGFIFIMGGFIMMACLGDENITFNPADDWIYLWGCTYIAWFPFEFTYIILSAVAFTMMLKCVNRMDKSTLIEIPSVVPFQPGNTVALFVTGWVFCGIGTVLLLSLGIASIVSMYVRLAAAITFWSVFSPCGIIATGLLAEVVRRRYSTAISTVGLVISVLVLLSAFYAGIPIFIYGIYWD